MQGRGTRLSAAERFNWVKISSSWRLRVTDQSKSSVPFDKEKMSTHKQLIQIRRRVRSGNVSSPVKKEDAPAAWAGGVLSSAEFWAASFSSTHTILPAQSPHLLLGEWS